MANYGLSNTDGLPGADVDTSFLQMPGMQGMTGVDASLPKREGYTIDDYLTMGVPGMALAGMDTVWRSTVGKEDDIPNIVKNWGTFGDFYMKNREGLALGGDLAAGIAIGTMAARAINGVGWLARMSGLSDVKYVQQLFTSGKTAEELIAPVKAYDEIAAARGVVNLADDAQRIALAKEAMSIGRTDAIKKAVASEVAILGGMHDSDVFYPDELGFVNAIALNGAFAGVGVGIEHAVLKRLITKSAQLAAPEAYAARNAFTAAQGTAIDTTLARGADAVGNGDRSALISLASAENYRLRDVIAEAQRSGESKIATDLNLQVQANTGVIKAQIEKLATDAPISAITTKHALSPGAVQSMLRITEDNPAALVNAISLDAAPSTLGERLALATRRTEQSNKLQEEIEGNFEKLMSGLSDADETALKAVTDNLIKRKKFLDEAEIYIAEPTGDMVPLNSWKPGAYDLPGFKITTSRETALEPRMYKIENLRHPELAAEHINMGVTDDGILIIPNVAAVSKTTGLGNKPAVTINRTNMTAEVGRDRGGKSLNGMILDTIGEDWHFATGQFGREINAQFKPSIASAVAKLTNLDIANDVNSQIYKWFANSTEEAVALYNAGSALRAQVHKIADVGDGTLLLYRGIKKSDSAEALHDIAPFTTSAQTASRMGDLIIAKRVAVDDIIMPIGNKTDGFGFLVRGNKTRYPAPDIGMLYAAPEKLAAEANAKALLDFDFAGHNSFAALDRVEHSAAYALLNKSLDAFNPTAGGKIVLAEGAHHTQLDFALAAIDRYGEAAKNRFQLATNWQGDWNKVELAAAAGKYTEFSELMDVITAQKSAKIRGPESLALEFEDVRKMLNLPATAIGEPSGIVKLFNDLYISGVGELGAVFKNIDDLKDAIIKNTKFPEIVPTTAGIPVALRGNNLNVPADAVSVRVTKRLTTENSFTFGAMLQHKIANAAMVHDKFTNAETSGAGLVSSVYNEMQKFTTGAGIVAKQVDKLIEGAQSGRGILTTAVNAARGVAPIEAMHQLETRMTMAGRKQIAELYRPYEELWAKMRSPSNSGHLDNFNLFVQSRRYGWDLEAAPESSGGSYMFKLKDTTYNDTKFAELYGRARTKQDAYMPVIAMNNGQLVYKPLTVTQLAFDTITSLQSLGQHALTNTNAIKDILGLPRMNAKEWWVPPRNLRNGSVRYLIDDVGDMKTVVWGRTEKEVNDKVTALTAPGAEHAGAIVIDQKQMGKYFDLTDQAFSKLVDYSDSLAQTGRSMGRMASAVLDRGTEVLDSALSTINNQFESLIKRTRIVAFEPQYNYAKRMSEQLNKPDNIFSQYLRALTGSSGLSPATRLGEVYYKAESIYDEFANAAYDKARNALGVGAHKVTPEVQRNFERLQSTMGNASPFADVAEYAARTFKVVPPQSMKAHMAKLANFTSFATLRFLELGQSLLNMTSLAATMPAVLRGMQRGLGETDEQWLTRINAFGAIIGTKQPTARFDGMRAMVSGVHALFDPAMQPVVQRAWKEGWVDAKVAEIIETLNKPHETMTTRMVKQLGGWTTFMADKSEELSRGIAFMTGYQFGKRALQFTDENNLMLFAQRFANDVIADYRPHNKPQIFQGAVGIPLGLFQTFTWNYMQRLYGYIENRQTRAFVSQMATQAALFGTKSVPGFNALLETFYSNYDGTVNPVDALQNKLGTETADLLLYGTLANAPKIAGYLAGTKPEGISIYTRGDANPRIPGSTAPAPIAAGLQIYGALNNIVDAMAVGGINRQQIAETVASHSINRPLRGLIELALGSAADQRGQLINDDVRTSMGTIARLVGMRTLTETKLNEAYYRLRTTEAAQNSKMRDLRDATRAAMRGGSLDAGAMNSALQNYVRFGGNPSNFSRWLRDNYTAAVTTRTDRAFLEALKDPRRGYDTLRLMNNGVMSPNYTDE